MAEPLRLHEPDTAPPPAPDAPLLVTAAEAARLCARSLASWWRDQAAGRVPAPIKLAGRTLWKRSDLELWVGLDCPARAVFEARRKSAR